MKFVSNKFSFNDIHCSLKEVSLIWGDNDFIEYGLNVDKSIEYDGLNWKDVKDTQPKTFTLHIVHEVDGVAKVWTREKIRDIESWLVTDDFMPFVSDDDINITYYLKAVNVVRRFNHNMLGWLEIEFQPISNNGFINRTIVLKDAKRLMSMSTIPSLTIINESDFNDKYYPVVKIDNLVGEVTFNNITTGKSLIVRGNGNIVVDNKMRTISDSLGNNLLTESNRQWLYLTKGVNKVQVIGDCTVTILAQYEVRV